MIKIRVQALLNLTESQEKLETAIKNVLGDIEIKIRESRYKKYLEAELYGLDSLEHLNGVLKRNRVRSAFRRVLTSWAEEDRLHFRLNRQAAFAGHASLYIDNESALGPIEVNIIGDVSEAINLICN